MLVNSTSRALFWIRFVVFALGFYPVIRWFYLGITQDLSVNPAEYLIRSSGLWAIIFLWLTLVVSPLRHLMAIPSLIRVRRPLGLFAFFYTFLHTVAWALWEQGLQLSAMWADILMRPFVAMGAIATVLMSLLACTSTKKSMQSLGRNWKRLHRSVYVIALLSIVHFYLVRSGKNDFNEVYVYAVILAVLLLMRLLKYRR